jgi:DNA repair ATPase RecN
LIFKHRQSNSEDVSLAAQLSGAKEEVNLLQVQVSHIQEELACKVQEVQACRYEISQHLARLEDFKSVERKLTMEVDQKDSQLRELRIRYDTSVEAMDRVSAELRDLVDEHAKLKVSGYITSDAHVALIFT